MAKEAVVYKTNTFVDGRIAVTYLIRDGSTVKQADKLLPAGTNVAAYGEANKDTLFSSGVDAPAVVSPLAVFESVKGRSAQAVHLGAIFAAFTQLKLGGTVADMKVAAKQAYQGNDEQLATLLAFIAKYQAASQADKDELAAIAIFAVSSLITSQ